MTDGGGGAAMADLTLFLGNKTYSSWSMRGWLAVRLAGLAFDEVVIPLRRPETVEAIRKVTPSGRVPALHWRQPDGRIEVLWDSLAIGETLAERCPDRGLWPAADGARAHARSILAEMHGGFATLRQQLPMNLRRDGPAAQPDADCGADIARIVEIWEDCRRHHGAAGPFLFGTPTLADVAFAPVATRFRSYRIGLPDLAQAYVDTIHRWALLAPWFRDAAVEPWRIDAMEL